MMVSNHGFNDILTAGTIVFDPSRVAAQIVSGIGFLGAGIIITRRGAVHGLATAAAVWESAAIGMAAGAGLLLLGSAVVVLHFVSALAFNVVERNLTPCLRGSVRPQVIYENGRGVLRELLNSCGQQNWQLGSGQCFVNNILTNQSFVNVSFTCGDQGQRPQARHQRRCHASRGT